jgi:uncharacterized protein involved in exopolysaccharide biosynthesis
MEMQQLLWAVLKGWWIILAFTLMSLGIGLFYSYTQTPMYETTSLLVVKPTEAVDGTYDKIYSLDALAGRTGIATTYSQLLQSQAVAELAAEALGVSPAMLADYERNCVALPDSVVLQLNIQGPSPYLAADLANAIGAIGTRYTRQFHEMYELEQVDLAQTNIEPVSPDHFQNAVLSVLMGIIFGIGSVLLREALIYLTTARPEQSHSPASTTAPGAVAYE